MADLGSLNFSVHLKDCTEQDYEQIKKKLVEKQVKLNTKLGVKVDRQIIRESIDNALKSKIFKVNVGVNKINVPSEVKAKLKIDDASLRDSISSAVNKKKYKINIVVDKAKVSDVIKQALQKAGYKYNTTASDVRQQRILDIQAKMAERAALAEQRLTNARMQAARASGTHNAAMKRENTAMSSQSRIAGELKNQIANVYSIYTLERFVRGLYTIGGEFQKQRIALTSILGDSMKAETIFNRIKDLAVVSPFQFKELASYAKQLSAYSIPYEELYDTTKRLADISAGVGVDMGRIILAYGQVRSAAFLRGQELRQFTEAGIPLVDELAKRFTKLTGVVTSAGDVFDKISRKEVSFGMVKDVLWELTDEGGKFYNMQEALAESLAGKWSNLQDAWDVMMADIAEGNSGVLSDSLELLTDLMKHWGAVADILGILVGIYGSYKTAVIAVNVAQKSSFAISQMQAYYTWLNKGVKVTKAAAVAQWALNSAMKVNPWVFWITTLGAIVTTLTVFQEKVETVAEKIKKLNIEFSKNIEKIKEEESKAKGYISRIFDKTNGIDAQRRAYLNLQKIYPSLFENMKFEQFLLEGEYQAIQKVLSASKEREKVKSAGLVIGATNNRNEAQRELNRLKSRREYYQSLDGYENVIESLDEDIKKQEEVLSQAQKTLNDALENYSTYKIKKDDKNPAWFKKATELYEKFGIERLKPDAEGGLQKYIENIIGANEDASSTLSEWTKKEGEWNEETRKSIDKAKLLKNATDEILKTFGRVTKETQNTKDPIAEQWKARTDLIDKAVSSYEKWRKIEGEEAASQRVKGISEFAPIFDKNGVNLNLKDPSRAYKYIQGQLDRSKEKQEDLYISLGVKIDKAGIDSAKKEVDDALKEIEKYVSQTGEKWDLYKKLFEATGNKSLSMNIAFGGEVSFKSVVDDLRNQLSKALENTGSKFSVTDVLAMKEDDVKKQFGEGVILKLYQSINEESKKMRSESLENLLGMIEDYKDYAQKIKDIERNLQKDLADIESQRGQLGEEATDRLIAQRKKKASEDAASTKFEQFKSSEDWAKTFDDLNRLSSATLSRLIKNLEEFKNTTGQSLKVNEFKELVNVLKKLRDESESRNPFKTLSDGIKEYAEATEKLKKAQKELGFIQDGGKVTTGVSEMSHTETKKTDGGLSYQTKVVDKLTPKLKTLADAEKEVTDAQDKQNEASDKVQVGFGDIVDMANLLIGTLGDLGSAFDALGNDNIGDTLSTVQEVAGGLLNTAQSGATLFAGISSGNPMAIMQGATGIVSGITGIIGSIAKAHDKKLDKAIEKSKLRAQELQNVYDAIERGLEHFLGSGTEMKLVDAEKDRSELIQLNSQIEAIRKKKKLNIFDEIALSRYSKEAEKLNKRVSAYDEGGAYGYQRALMEEQISELEKQKQAELDKKDVDQSKVADYEAQITEMQQQVKDFAEETAETLYGIDLKGWASELGDALYEAWQKGENGAEAFKDKVADIMGSVMNSVLKIGVLEPAMKQLQTMLFGEDGKSGYFGKDFSLDSKEVKGIADYLMSLDKKTDAYYSALDEVDAYMKKKYGVSLKESEENSSSLSKGIQESITEDTANILASYINGIRADVSVKRALLEKWGNEILPKYNVIAEQQLTQLRAIANNTLRSAQNTEANVALVQEVRDMLNIVIDRGGRKIKI
ncbi:MAG: hypothetical protein [Bacteriophage sp.]|nr:MAG: hypothetical protein [Bacteriophage sp.]